MQEKTFNLPFFLYKLHVFCELHIFAEYYICFCNYYMFGVSREYTCNASHYPHKLVESQVVYRLPFSTLCFKESL